MTLNFELVRYSDCSRLHFVCVWNTTYNVLCSYIRFELLCHTLDIWSFRQQAFSPICKLFLPCHWHNAGRDLRCRWVYRFTPILCGNYDIFIACKKLQSKNIISISHADFLIMLNHVKADQIISFVTVSRSTLKVRWQWNRIFRPMLKRRFRKLICCLSTKWGLERKTISILWYNT